MAQNSSWFAAFVRETRDRRGWSQQQVHDAGGPSCEMQAAIERDERDPIPDEFLSMFDIAYSWRRGYAQSLAELGEHAENPELSEMLRGGNRDAAVLADYRGQPPQEVWKTFGGLYKNPDQASGIQPAYLGFEPTTGEPAYLEGPLLTNVPFKHLHPMILARHGTTMVDVNVVDESSMKILYSQYGNGEIRESAAQQPIKLYRTGTPEPTTFAERIAIDPLSEITSLSEAKNLAEALRRIRPHVRTSTIRAAFTFLAIVAFGEDPIVTMTELSSSGSDTAAEFNVRFNKFWQEFYDPAKAGPELARPDHRACDLLAGVLAARDEVLNIDIAYDEGQRFPRYDVARTVRPTSSLSPAAPAMLFYDSNIVPELPVALSHMRINAVLTFYAAQLIPGGGVSPPLGPRAPYLSVGITSADDHDVIAQYKPNELSTLTNYCDGQAIYCENYRAPRRIWIPHR